MTTKAVAKARESFADTINRVIYTKERVVVTKRGKRAVAIVPVEDYDLLQKLENEIDLAAAKEALADYEKHGGVPFKAIKTKRK